MLHLWALWAACSLVAAPLLRAASAAASSARVSNATDAPASASAPDPRDTSGDSCAYYAAAEGQPCRSPRTCYDCLNVPLESEPQFGACESMRLYDASLDFRADGSTADSGSPTDFSGGWFHMFPSPNSSYCESADPACVACDAVARNLSAADSFMAQTTKFCVGASGCVCVLSCEASVWAARVSDSCASTPEPSAPYLEGSGGGDSSGQETASADKEEEEESHTKKDLVWITVGTVALPVALVAGFYVRYVRQPRGRGQRARRSMSPQSQLQLAGWRALQEELVAQQKQGQDPEAARQVALVTISPVASR